MPGVVEETSKVALHTINILNRVPVLLALVLVQIFILAALTYLSLQRDTQAHARLMTLIERCVGPGSRAEIPSELLIMQPSGSSRRPQP